MTTRPTGTATAFEAPEAARQFAAPGVLAVRDKRTTEIAGLGSDRGWTSIADAVVAKIAGLSAREVGVQALGVGVARARGGAPPRTRCTRSLVVVASRAVDLLDDPGGRAGEDDTDHGAGEMAALRAELADAARELGAEDLHMVIGLVRRLTGPGER